MGMNQTEEFLRRYTDLVLEEVLCIESYAKSVTADDVYEYDIKEEVERILSDASLRRDKLVKKWWIKNIHAVTSTIIWEDLNCELNSSYPVLKYYYLGDAERAKRELNQSLLNKVDDAGLEERLLLLRVEFWERIHSMRFIMGSYPGFKRNQSVPCN